MTIQDALAFVRNLWDWDILRGCFGASKIRPTDIDGAVNRRRKFLFLETKERDVPLGIGQEIFFRELAELPGVTVFLIWGDTDNPEWIQILNGRQRSRKMPCDLRDLRRRVAEWYATVDRGGFPHIPDYELERAS